MQRKFLFVITKSTADQTGPLKRLLCVQTTEEFQILQGAMINAQIAKRGKTVSSRKLRHSAKKFDGMVIDYRQMGYVTEVKDQVRTGSSRRDGGFAFAPEILCDDVLVCRATVAPVGPSALQEPLRDKSSRRRVSSSP